MLIIEREEELQVVYESLQKGDSFWIPMYSDPYRHFMKWHQYNYENMNRVLIEARRNKKLKD